MGIVINTNISALNTWNQLNKNTNAMNKSLEKLSSGYKINSSSDDASGLAISEKMLNQINGLDQANDNTQKASSLLQTADGALDETNTILARMRELTVQSASDTNTDEDRTDIQDEVDALVKEINTIANTTQFNTKNLLDGSLALKATTATATKMANTSVEMTAANFTAATLSALTDTAGNSLGIVDGDTITVSYIQNGALVTASTTVSGTQTLSTLLSTGFGAATGFNVTASSTTANLLTATATTAGAANGIYGLTVTVTDTDGDVMAKATNALSSFTQTVQAKDKANDGTATVLTGANTDQEVKINIDNMDATALGVQNLDVSTQAAANIALKAIDTATQTVSAQRSALGAIINQLSSTSDNLSTASENLSAANSVIKDTDMASEMATYTKLSTITQAATAMLAHANSDPESVLKLLES